MDFIRKYIFFCFSLLVFQVMLMNGDKLPDTKALKVDIPMQNKSLNEADFRVWVLRSKDTGLHNKKVTQITEHSKARNVIH